MAESEGDRRGSQRVQSRAFRLLVYVATGILAALLWCWFKTVRVTRLGPVPPFEAGGIYATWHRSFIYAVYFWRGIDGVMMASASRDGEWAGGMIRRFGNRVVRGSSSRGGRVALEEIVEEIRSGAPGGLLPDAPRGPPRRCKAGILALAQRAGRPIIPVQFGMARCYRMGSWDRTMIPLPFSRVVAVHGEPFTVDPSLEGAAFERRLAELDAEMNRLTDVADAHFGGEPEAVLASTPPER